jgi:hypothetical protein
VAKYPPPNVPFVEAYHKGGKQRPTAIIIRSSSTPSIEGSAFAIAQYWHRPSSPHEACQYVVDEAAIYRCVDDKTVAGHWHCSDKGAIRINVCAEPVPENEYWDDAVRAKVLGQTADLVSQLCLAYKIPNAYLDDEGFRRWKKWRTRRRGGMFIHLPGAWPKQEFQNDVQSRMRTIKRGGV